MKANERREMETEHAPDNAYISIRSGSPDHEINLFERKLWLYWDRIRDLLEKEKGGIEVIRYHPDTPPDVLAWLKSRAPQETSHYRAQTRFQAHLEP